MKRLSLFLLIACFAGCSQENQRTDNPVGETFTTTQPGEESMQRHFQYALPDWCQRLFGAKLGTDGLISVANELDLHLDLVAYENWDEVTGAGVSLSCVLPDMGQDENGDNIAPFVPGFNDPEQYDRVYDAVALAIEKAGDAGVPFVLVFTGFNTGADRDDQFDRIVDGYTKPRESGGKSLVQLAEEHKVTLVIEMLNTNGDEATWRGHPGYLGNDTTELVTKVIRPINHKRFRLAFDVFHVEMMNEDVMAMIEAHSDVIGYVHVAGVMKTDDGSHHPQNRGELTIEEQLVDYAEVMRVLAAKLPEGTYCLLEYIPQDGDRDSVVANLKAAIELCESKIQ